MLQSVVKFEYIFIRAYFTFLLCTLANDRKCARANSHKGHKSYSRADGMCNARHNARKIGSDGGVKWRNGGMAERSHKSPCKVHIRSHTRLYTSS